MDKDKVKKLCKEYQNGILRVDQFTDALEKEGMSSWIGYVIHDLHRRVRFLENIGKLDTEDQAVAYRWEREREERSKLYDQIEVISKKNNPEEWEELMDKLRGPSHCEHGRSWASNCMACEEIERTLFPDMFPPEEDED